jgi:hypothetical protein
MVSVPARFGALREEWERVDPPRRPVLLINPRSGDGKAARAALADRARERGVEPVVLGPTDDLATLIAIAVDKGADALGMAGGRELGRGSAAGGRRREVRDHAESRHHRKSHRSIRRSRSTQCRLRQTASPDHRASAARLAGERRHGDRGDRRSGRDSESPPLRSWPRRLPLLGSRSPGISRAGQTSCSVVPPGRGRSMSRPATRSRPGRRCGAAGSSESALRRP